jgi:hypothetical protein
MLCNVSFVDFFWHWYISTLYSFNLNFIYTINVTE